MWESMAAWFTPTLLFCLTNFIIATIFIASNKHHHHADSNSIARVSSFLDRTISIKLSSYTESQHQYPPAPPQFKTANYSSTSRLAQSIFLSSNYVTRPESTESEGNSVSQLVRVPSFLDRVKSFKISSAFKSGPEYSTQTEKADSDTSHNPERHVSTRIKSEMKKSRSEVRIAADDGDQRRPATARESRDDVDEEVDAKADDFISRFKQQLKLQRLGSLVRYNDLVNRRR